MAKLILRIVPVLCTQSPSPRPWFHAFHSRDVLSTKVLEWQRSLVSHSGIKTGFSRPKTGSMRSKFDNFGDGFWLTPVMQTMISSMRLTFTFRMHYYSLQNSTFFVHQKKRILLSFPNNGASHFSHPCSRILSGIQTGRKETSSKDVLFGWGRSRAGNRSEAAKEQDLVQEELRLPLRKHQLIGIHPGTFFSNFYLNFQPSFRDKLSPLEVQMRYDIKLSSQDSKETGGTLMPIIDPKQNLRAVSDAATIHKECGKVNKTTSWTKIKVSFDFLMPFQVLWLCLNFTLLCGEFLYDFKAIHSDKIVIKLQLCQMQFKMYHQRRLAQQFLAKSRKPRVVITWFKYSLAELFHYFISFLFLGQYLHSQPES